MDKSDYATEILQVLENSPHPMDVEKIRKSIGISHWNAALTHLLQLYIERKICAEKTSKSWIFWAKKSKTPITVPAKIKPRGNGR